MAASVLRIGASAVDDALLDFRTERAGFRFDLRQTSEEFVKFLWSQVRHG